MNDKKRRDPPHFPVMDGAQPAPREDQIAGIVQRVWADSRVYHQDVEVLLREWLTTDQCVVSEAEFAILLDKARGEFDRIAVPDGSGARACPAHSLVECVYWDVQQLERAT
ncbi:hypothetical protein AB4Z18_03290 [Leifsonia sp. 2TAF2]|uniref:hypothetical protein n=1 Tax=Leifsonia sp. 2TAF2 TaxID=3233009 RepID=UPI003F9AC60C